MKKIITSAALAASLLLACNNVETVETIDRSSKTIEIAVSTADADATRATLGTALTDNTKKQLFWESTDEFDFAFFNSTSKSTVALTPSELANESSVAKFTVSVPSGYESCNGFSVAFPRNTVSFPKENDSYDYLYVSVPATQEFNTTGHNMSAVPLASKIVDISKVAATVQLYPLVAMGEMTISGLPNESTTNKISKITLSTAWNSNAVVHALAATSYRYSVTDLSVDDTGSSFVGGSNTLVLESATAVDYATAPTFYFTAINSLTNITKLTVEIETTDELKYTKVISMGGTTGIDPLYFRKGEISKFTVDMSTATVENMAAGFAVEWSEGYLKYDASQYVIAGPYEHGLFFKWNSTTGFDVTDYDSIIGGTNKVLSKTGTSAVDWTTQITVTGYNFYAPIGPIVGAMSTNPAAYADIPFNTGDPCALVAVAAGENSWRLPTKADIADLVTVAGNNTWTPYSYDSATNTLTTYANKDNKPHVMSYTDGNKTYYFRSTGYVQPIASNNTVTLYNGGNNGYYIAFWSSDLYDSSDKETVTTPTDDTRGWCYYNSTMNNTTIGAVTIGGLPATPAPTYGAAYQDGLQSMIPVRCVRDKK